jgi:lipopolysaccharide/colanic/teichoic acid biosynthesis glycosyltransferase
LKYTHIKRLIDVSLSIILLFISIPFFIISFLLIKLESKGDVIFVDKRIGKGGKIFSIYKLRTMYLNSYRGFVTENDPRLTKFGAFLRKTSIDELPQLINVLKGDMSLIGPRPDLISNFKKYDDSIKRRLLLRPGITGWAQVNGRNSITWNERYIYDLEYVNKVSVLFDLKIWYLTLKIVLLMKNINISR